MLHFAFHYRGATGQNRNCTAMKHLLVFLALATLVAGHSLAANVTINGAQTYQTVDGYGVNINTGWWNNGEVKPAIDMLVDQLGASIFRSVIEEMDWEAVNDNSDPNVFNWTYYNSVYSNAKFQGIWNTLKYLNQKGIQQNGLVISFMGKAPDWMGANATIDTNKEDELVESVASCLYYARFTAGIQFSKISPFNEADTGGVEGPNMGTTQFARVLNKLALKLDAIGMSDVRFHAPEAAGGMDPFFDAMVTYPAIMGKLDLWAIHTYDDSTDDAQTKISASAYPSKKFWVTETASFSNVLGHLDENPTGILIWDGLDSVYEHAIRAGRGNTPPNDSPGIEAPLIAYNTSTHLYTPRKGFYENAQLFKFVAPGAVRIGATDDNGNLTTYAFRQPGTGRLTIVGRNASGSAIAVNGTLTNLPTTPSTLEFYRTNSTLNLALGTDVAVSPSGSFSVSIPANTYFTLVSPAPTFLGHEVKVDAQGKLVPWFAPAANAYHEFLTKRWNFIKSGSFPTPGNPTYPQYFLHSGFATTNPGIDPDYWMNAISEVVPNWFESARLYYAYSGDAAPLALAKAVMDHSLTNGISPANFAWPNLPYTGGNHSEVPIRGFFSNNIFKQHETQPGYAGDMGLAYFRMWQYSGEQKYLTAAINTANTLAAKARVGSATQSIWPYSVVMDTGEITSEYGANFMGCYELFSHLIAANANPSKNADYEAARTKCRNFLLNFPMVTGYWADGHPDNLIHSNQNRSNTPKSNVALYMLDFPGFDPNFTTNLPALIAWTETWFVNRTSGSEPATYYGANIVGEQDDFNYKMDYQTARYAAECAQWFRVSGDASYQEKAYRALNFVTYCSTPEGRPTESPFSLNIATWWGDCFGECPRMFYQAFKAMPEWAPPRQNHILYSYDILTNVSYAPYEVAYNAAASSGVEYFRLAYQPTDVTVDGVNVPPTTNPAVAGWTSRLLPGGDYAITLRRSAGGRVRLFNTAENNPPTCTLTSPANNANVATGANILLTATAVDSDGTIAKVEFFNGTTKLGEDTTTPYHFSWNNLTAGTYTLTATATDNRGAQTTSPSATLTVGPSSSIAFGSDADVSSFDTITDNTGAYINACRFPCATTMSINAIHARVGTIANNKSYKCAVYEEIGGVITKLREGATLTGVQAGLHDFPLTSAANVTAGNYYWLAIWSDDVNAKVIALPNGSVSYAAYPYGTWPNTLSFNGSTTFTYSIYATGTATANSAPTCSAGANQTITLPASAALSGSASDDGLPAALTVAWSPESGPGTVSFGNATARSTSASFSAPGNYILRLTASDGAVTTASDVLVTVRDSFAAWAARNGVPADNTDFNHDGVPNLMAYALGLSPTANSTANLPFATRETISGSDYLAITVNRVAIAPGITYTAEVSGDLTQWDSGPTFTTVIENTPTLLKVRDNTPIAPPTTLRFIRLQVTQP
jgi:hypothetical protein